ncbi:PD-(D/E)XK nuclease superfamily protein [anaerobic digester metagenome]
MTENEIAKEIWSISFDIHQKLGPGIFESVYEEILAHELLKAGIAFERQKLIPVTWDTLTIPGAFRIDFLLEKKVILELKSVEQLSAVHKKQLITYLKLTNLKLGLLINFNTNLLKDGFIRLVNNL